MLMQLIFFCCKSWKENCILSSKTIPLYEHFYTILNNSSVCINILHWNDLKHFKFFSLLPTLPTSKIRKALHSIKWFCFFFSFHFYAAIPPKFSISVHNLEIVALKVLYASTNFYRNSIFIKKHWLSKKKILLPKFWSKFIIFVVMVLFWCWTIFHLEILIFC